MQRLNLAIPDQSFVMRGMTPSFRQRLQSGERLLGTIASIPSVVSAEILAKIGFDWLFIDAEHGALSNDSMLQMVSVIGNQTATLVRTPAPEETPIKQALDLGVTGIIAPQVNSADQAARVVQYARYSPQGARGVGVGRAQGYGMAFQEYVQRAQTETTVVIQAEHYLAVENIEQTVQVEGIDAVLIGPYDLSASLGKMGQLDDPEVTGAISQVTETCLKQGIPLGIFGLSADAVAPYVARGYQLIVAGVDTLLLGQAATQMKTSLSELTARENR